jgi:hypothetical protein
MFGDPRRRLGRFQGSLRPAIGAARTYWIAFAGKSKGLSCRAAMCRRALRPPSSAARRPVTYVSRKLPALRAGRMRFTAFSCKFVLRFLKGDSLNFGPKCTPAAIARLRPSPVRSRIRSRSKEAKAASIVESRRPCEVVVSNIGSPSRPIVPWRLGAPRGKPNR